MMFFSYFIVYSDRRLYPRIFWERYRPSQSLLIISIQWYGYTLNLHIETHQKEQGE
jgi:hypothetical protein